MTTSNPNAQSDPEAQSPGPVLVTGAFGFVGPSVVRALAADGTRVVATDIDTPANRNAGRRLMSLPSVEVRWADLTRPAQVETLLKAVAPAAIVHLAAVIPPRCYRRRELARAVNIDGTETLLTAAAALPDPPRFVQASSIAVYGPRNPHRDNGVLEPDTPVRPADLYGAHKVEVEELVRESELEWVILRLGGVLSVELSLGTDTDLLTLEAALPADNRIQTVDVRDVAAAFRAAITTDSVRETFLVAGDESHRLVQSEVGSALAEAMGLSGGLPKGRPGDPDNDEAWFATDWMDTTRSQEVLAYQQHSFPDMVNELRAKAGPKRYLLRVLAPLVREFMQRRSPYRDAPGTFADPWTAVRSRLGDPDPDQRVA
ncbi:NAD(P)-dependent oxidoreductase [Nocardia sp. BMG51109]|uniref:NAD-dependent epimerase/dehydratase family protein n=1 Tax=Nocardia sp. BMG51109 TaxID=1056816 RepID=UPI0004636E55|nr:NAD(P)-dependent oxidoreductase [Nocardia sp. BMG51109]